MRQKRDYRGVAVAFHTHFCLFTEGGEYAKALDHTDYRGSCFEHDRIDRKRAISGRFDP